MKKFRVLKTSKQFSVEGSTAKYVVYTCSYKARLITVNTLYFADEEEDALAFDEDTKTLTINIAVEATYKEWADNDGVLVKTLTLLPKSDLAIV